MHPAPETASAVVGARHAQDTERPDIETASDAYTEGRFGGPTGRWMLDRQARAIDALLRRTGGAPLRVLEVGGGHAQVTPLLLERGHSVVVHGSDPVCFRRVAPLRRAHPDRVGACAAGLWGLPFADRSFDLVLAIRLLAHVTRWRVLLAEMARVSDRYVMVEFARAGGVSLAGRVGDALFSLKRRVERTTRPYFTYDEAALAAELARLGFRHVGTVGQFAVPMVVHRLAKSPRLSEALEGALARVGRGDGARSPAVMLLEREQ
jgi:ubiquinone/menaquinone biosynthesis C-methylase UbiE